MFLSGETFPLVEHTLLRERVNYFLGSQYSVSSNQHEKLFRFTQHTDYRLLFTVHCLLFTVYCSLLTDYFFFDFFGAFFAFEAGVSFNAARAAASRAIGTRNGEQLT